MEAAAVFGHGLYRVEAAAVNRDSFHAIMQYNIITTGLFNFIILFFILSLTKVLYENLFNMNCVI